MTRVPAIVFVSILGSLSALGACRARDRRKCPPPPPPDRYLYVDEVSLRDPCFGRQDYRVAGRLQPGQVVRRRQDGAQEHRFELARRGHRLPVTYVGSWPAVIRPGVVVIVHGRVRGDRFVTRSLAYRFPAFAPMQEY